MRNCFGTHNSTYARENFSAAFLTANKLITVWRPKIIDIYPRIAGYARILLEEIAQLMNRDVT
jgi:hypothetical protein